MGKLSFLKAIPFFSLANLAKSDLNPFVTLKDFWATIIQMSMQRSGRAFLLHARGLQIDPPCGHKIFLSLFHHFGCFKGSNPD